MSKLNLPEFKKSISDYLYKEEGFIQKEKLLTIGSLIILANIMLADDLYAAHYSHRSHSSHSSHGSHYNTVPRY